MDALGVSLRPAGLVDSDFVFRVKKASLGEYIRQTWGWDEALQRDFHVRSYDPTTTEIIVRRDADVGSAVIGTLIAEATEKQLPLTLQVLKANPRAKALYRRLGFVADGETETHHLMRLSPGDPPRG